MNLLLQDPGTNIKEWTIKSHILLQRLEVWRGYMLSLPFCCCWSMPWRNVLPSELVLGDSIQSRASAASCLPCLVCCSHVSTEKRQKNKIENNWLDTIFINNYLWEFRENIFQIYSYNSLHHCQQNNSLSTHVSKQSCSSSSLGDNALVHHHTTPGSSAITYPTWTVK